MGKTKKSTSAPVKISEKVVSEKVADLAHEASDESDDEDETGGVDEAGMKRLMELLGDDALDEFDAAQLDALTGVVSGDEENSEAGSDSGSEEDEEEGPLSDEDSEDDDEEEQEEEDDEEAGEGASEDDDEDVIALDDVSSVDEDAVPRQKKSLSTTRYVF